jgi:hypothetical protein
MCSSNGMVDSAVYPKFFFGFSLELLIPAALEAWAAIAETNW